MIFSSEGPFWGKFPQIGGNLLWEGPWRIGLIYELTKEGLGGIDVGGGDWCFFVCAGLLWLRLADPRVPLFLLRGERFILEFAIERISL